MAQEYAKASVALLTSRHKKNNDDQSPVVIRVYDPASQVKKDYRTGEFASSKDQVSANVAVHLKRFVDEIYRMKVLGQTFSFEDLEKNLFGGKNSISYLFAFLEDQKTTETVPAGKKEIDYLLDMLRHTNVGDVLLSKIDYNWVSRFDNMMKHTRQRPKTKSKKFKPTKEYPFLKENTRKKLLRALRKWYNVAVLKNLAPKDVKPFIGISTKSVVSEEVKRYLTVEELKLLVNGKFTPYKAHRNVCRWEEAKDLWLLSYHWSGLNLKDILDIRWSQIQGNTILRSRTKTSSALTLRINKHVQTILSKYKGKNKDYIFDHLKIQGDLEAQDKNHSKILGWVGDNIRRIAKESGIANSKQINFYSARHTFAVHYMTLVPGASIFQLMIYMGHKDEDSTKNYLQSLIGNSEVKILDFLDRAIETPDVPI